MIKEKIDKLNIENIPTHFSFKKLLGINEDIMNAIYTIGIEKFNEKDFNSSLSLFAFLTALNSANTDYLFRLGICSQKNENFDLALKAYEAALDLDPELLAAMLFASDCCLAKKDQGQAAYYLKRAKEVAENQPSQSLEPLMSFLASTLNNPN
jgi:tetratricopeptide (TPR) repeat protein